MASCRKCPTCSYRWPLQAQFAKCPRCLVRTVAGPGEQDAPAKVALHLSRVWSAEHVYEKREAEREKRGDPTPDQLGVLEARRLIDLDRRAAA